VAPTTAGVATAFERLDLFQAEQGLDPEAAWRVHVALDEILSNVVRHGGGEGRAPTIDVTLNSTAFGLEVAVVDDGPEFDPLTLSEPDVTSSLEDRQPGGLGVYLVRRLMDRVEYTRRDGRNHLVMTRRTRAQELPAGRRE
jgi:anti-sigma regulatory factor (Ser/Thr protein kinase)